MRFKKIYGLFFASIALLSSLAYPSNNSTADTVYHPRPASTLKWHPCDHGLAESDCALLTVPLDYAHPDKDTITIGISRIKATLPNQRIGTLFVNSGGPGGDGDEALGMVGESFIHIPTQYRTQAAQEVIDDFQPIRQHFDIIGFDPRGIGRGTQLRCPTIITVPHTSFPPVTEKDYNEFLAYNHTLGLECERLAGPLINHVDTLSIINDIDNIRKALGEKTISFYGESYGTEIGQLYTEKYPEHLRATVLDSNINHTETDLFKEFREDAAAEEESLGYYDKLCHIEPLCKTPGKNIIHNLETLIAKAKKSQLRTTDGQIIPPENISEAIRHLIEVSTSPKHFKTIGLIFSRTPQAYKYLSQKTPYSEFEGQGNFFADTVLCHDLVPIRFTPSYTQFNTEITKLKTIAPHMWRTINFFMMSLRCFNWPIPAQNPPAPLHIPTNLPMLLLVNKADPAAAPVFSYELHREIPSSRLIITDAIGHTILDNSNCGKVAIVNYLLTAQLPWFDQHCSG